MLKNINTNGIKDENINSIEELCTLTWKSLYKFIYFKVQNREEAEDITQETYVKAITYLKKNNTKIDTHIAFLKTVALNILRDKWRKNKRQGMNVNLDFINPVEASIEDSTEISIQRILIEEALNQLKDEYSTVIQLRILKGHSVAEAAKIMNKKEATLRVIQYRALRSLADILKTKINKEE